MKEVTVYTTNYCPYCTRAKNLLKKKGIPFNEVDLSDNDEKREALSAQTGSMTVPMIFIGDEFVGGSDDLHALDAAGELDKKVQG